MRVSLPDGTDPCPFCQPAEGRVFLRTDLVLGLWDGFPVSPGHALLVTRRHVADWFGATSAEQAALMDGIGRARALLEEQAREEGRALPGGYNVGFNAVAGVSDLALLVQSTDRQAAVITLVARARSGHGSLAAARQNARAWTALRGQVARVIRVMPLWKLQTIGREPAEFLYRQAEFRDDRIRLLPGVPAALRSFHGLVTHLVRGAWVDQVQRIPRNRPLLGEAPNLGDFLFGSDRANLAAYGQILREHQSGQCFYCGRRVSGAGDLDHFIPWSRYPVDLGHNFVYTHGQCNRDKRDYLAHPDHLRRWREQNLEAGETLAVSFAAARLAHDRERSQRIAVWAYGQGELAGGHVWLRGRELLRLPAGWARAMGEPGLRLAAEERADYRP